MNSPRKLYCQYIEVPDITVNIPSFVPTMTSREPSPFISDVITGVTSIGLPKFIGKPETTGKRFPVVSGDSIHRFPASSPKTSSCVPSLKISPTETDVQLVSSSKTIGSGYETVSPSYMIRPTESVLFNICEPSARQTKTIPLDVPMISDIESPSISAAVSSLSRGKPTVLSQHK